MKNSFTTNYAPEDIIDLRPEQLAELSEFFSHGEYANEGSEFLNDEIRTVDQALNLDEESFR